MSILKTILGTPPQLHINEDSEVSIKLANHSPCAKATNWVKWMVALPLKSLQGAYNAYLFLKSQDFAEIADQTYRGNAITPMPISFESIHIVSSPKLIHEVAFRHFRSDPSGLFEMPEKSSFLNLLRDLFPEYKNEISNEDFLFTCSRENTKDLRSPFMEFFLKSNARERMQPVLREVTKEILDSIEEKDGSEISAGELTETLTVAVLSRLCLDPTLSLKECQEIGRAASIAINYWLMFSSSGAQREEYKWAKDKLSQVIQSTNGEFVQSLHDAGMSKIRIYGTLMLVYIAGSETTSTALHSILWRLGQRTNLQDEIVEDTRALDPFIKECLRILPPVYFFGRVAREDLVITVKNKGTIEWEYPISKGERLMCSPYLAGKEEHQISSSSTSYANQYPTMVFSVGHHACPGRPLAENEISTFINAALEKYIIISTPNKQNLSAKGMLTLKPEEVGLKFIRRAFAK
jgi:cytochrome P450